ncbi:MAG TPA: serine hydrolase domain-containing protein [Actinospica sp.]|nr:serine hydrolase domain-containing protein [Actinospica sp.]
MSEITLTDVVRYAAEKHGIPGLSVAVWHEGAESFAAHGVTNLDHPEPVDRNTLYAVGSTSKPFAATALMHLVARGEVELDAPVRRYIPELTLPNEEWTAQITVENLLNHTAGLDWRLITDTGDGDDALSEFIVRLSGLDQLGAPGGRASYSQLAFSIVARIVEKVTGQTFEQAVQTLVLDPLGLDNTFYALDEVMARKPAFGHNANEDGELVVARQWKDNRANNGGAGVASSVADLLRFARFHLGDGHVDVLPDEFRELMQIPTAEIPSSTLGDAFGLCWFIKDIGGVRTIGHGGSGNGQFVEFVFVPERNFAIVSAANAGPNGVPCNQEVVSWALEHYLGVIEEAPEPEPYDAARAQEVVGAYENDAMTFTITTDGAGLTLEVLIRPEIRAASEVELPADYPPFPFGLLAGGADEYIVTDGAMKGQRGFFTRGADGGVTGVDMAGRLFTRVR